MQVIVVVVGNNNNNTNNNINIIYEQYLYSLEPFASHRGIARKLAIQPECRGGKDGEEGTESQNGKVSNPRGQWRLTAKVRCHTLILRILGPTGGANFDARDGRGAIASTNYCAHDDDDVVVR